MSFRPATCLALTVLLLLSMLGKATATPAGVAASSSTGTDGRRLTTVTPPLVLSADEHKYVDLVNAERTSRGITPLTVDPLLIEIARGHSSEMALLNYFSHQSPSVGLTTPLDRYLAGLRQSGSTIPDNMIVGENIYYCSVSNARYDAAYGHKALMKSPDHRANILNPEYTKIGVGIYQGADGEVWVSEEFVRDTPENSATSPSH
ncbi:MAG: CAP domain-containing protein [Capsulimonadaceae bacterium]